MFGYLLALVLAHDKDIATLSRYIRNACILIFHTNGPYVFVF